MSQYWLTTEATCHRFSGVAGQEGYCSEDLLLMVVGWKGLVTRVEKAVGWKVKQSPHHMELPICSGVSLHVLLSLLARSDLGNGMQVEILKRCYVILQVKCPSLWTDCSQSCSVCRVHGESGKYGVSGETFEWKARYSQGGTLFFKLCALHSGPIATKPILFVGHARGVIGM